MPIDTDLVGEFIPKLYSTSSLEDRFKLVGDAITSLGFDTILYSYVPNNYDMKKLIPPTMLVSDRFPSDFLNEYRTKGMDQHDFTIRLALDGVMEPIDWVKWYNSGKLSTKEKSVVELAHKYGMKNGMSKTFMSSNYGVAGISITSFGDDITFDKLKEEHIDTAFLVAQCFHNQVHHDNRQYFFKPFQPRITKEEKLILKYEMSGIKFNDYYLQIDKSSANVRRKHRILREKFDGLLMKEIPFVAERLGLLEDIDITMDIENYNQ